MGWSDENPKLARLLWSLCAVGIFALSTLEEMAPVRDLLIGIGGGLLGGHNIRRSGDTPITSLK